MIQLKRIYQNPSADDGYRVLVERLWPRGLTKVRAAIQLWLKEVAPTPELRKWYSHDVAKWTEFSRRYRTELKQKASHLKFLADKGREGTLTLVFGARDEIHNSAVVLKNVLEAEWSHTEAPTRAGKASRASFHTGG